MGNIARGLGMPHLAQDGEGFGAAYSGNRTMTTLRKFKVLGYDCTLHSLGEAQ